MKNSQLVEFFFCFQVYRLIDYFKEYIVLINKYSNNDTTDEITINNNISKIFIFLYDTYYYKIILSFNIMIVCINTQSYVLNYYD